MAMTSEFTDAHGLIAPALWPYRSGALGLGWVEEQARLSDRLADTVGEVTTDVHGRWSSVLPDVYEGPGAKSLYVAMDPTRKTGETVSGRLWAGAKLMRNYADAVGGLKQRLANLESEATAWRATVVQGIWVSAEDLPFVRVAATGWLLESASQLAQPQGATLSWDEHRPSVEQNQAYIATVTGLTEQIRDAIETLVRGLQSVEATDERISALTFAMGGHDGASRSTHDGEWFLRDRAELEAMTPEQLVQWWDGLETWQQEAMADTVPLLGLDPRVVQGKLTDALERAGSESGTDIASLDVTLQVFGHDDITWAAVVAGAGGAAVASVVHAAGQSAFTRDCDVLAARRVATRLREGLSHASTDWEAKQAQAFALEMLRGTDGGRHASAVAFLFGDHQHNPMGEEFTVAMATELDSTERDPIGWQEPWQHTGPEPGILYLDALATGQSGYPTRLQDPLGRVLSTLGEYPDAALEWLTDEGADEYSPTNDPDDTTYRSAGRARLEHYFQERDSSTRAGTDGFEGVAALWSGAQEATGGPLDPGTYGPAASSYDPAVWEKVATVTTFAVRGLSDNPTFIPEQVSTLGTIELAHGTSNAMPHLTHNPIHEYSKSKQQVEDPDAGFLPGEGMPGVEGGRAISNVTRAALADIAAAAASSPQADGVLTQGVAQYQETLVAMARERQTDPRQAIERIVKLEAFLAGARDGGEAGVMNRKDEAAEQAIRVASTGAGAIPMPQPVERVGKLALKGVVAWATDGALDAWTSNLAEAQTKSAGEALSEGETVGEAAAKLAEQLGVKDLSANGASGTFDIFYEAIYSKSSDGIATE